MVIHLLKHPKVVQQQELLLEKKIVIPEIMQMDPVHLKTLWIKAKTVRMEKTEKQEKQVKRDLQEKREKTAMKSHLQLIG